MYNDQQPNYGAAGGAAAAVLGRGAGIDAVLPPALVARVNAGRVWFEENELVVDLGTRIGSREWWRGALTCLALCATAWSLGPELGPLQGAEPAPLTAAQWQEARALTIAPLAYGADTGRRMAATDAVERLAEPPERPRIELTATLGRGDGFVRALRRAGVADADADKVGSLVSGALSLGALEAGTRMDIVLGRRPAKHQPRPLDKVAFRARLDLALSVERPEGGGALMLRRIPIAVDDTPMRIQGEAGSSLYRAARAAGAPAKAVEAFLRALSSRMSVNRGIASSDRFDMVVEQRRAETGEVEIGDLVYAGIEQGKRNTKLVKWSIGGRSEWFEATGVGQQRGVFQRPVVGRLTSSFGMRLHPLLGYSRFHKGVDFGAPAGTPIVAAADGVVSFAGWHGGHGKYVKIGHGGNLGTGYGHMSRIAVRSGERVRQGEIIGYVGSTGLSTGPHLHYEVYKGGQAINPTGMSFVTQATLSGSELRKFKDRLAHYLTVKPGAPPRFAGKASKADNVQADRSDNQTPAKRG